MAEAASSSVTDVAAVLAGTKLISSDSHIIEPPDVWAPLEGRLGDRAPRIVTAEDGDWWYVDNKKTMSFLGINAGKRFEIDSRALRTSGYFDDVTPGATDPYRYLTENERDGVWALDHLSEPRAGALRCAE